MIKWLRFGCGEAASVSRELARLFSHYKFEVLRSCLLLQVLHCFGLEILRNEPRGDNSKTPRAVEGRDRGGSKRSSMRSAAGASLISLRSDRSTLIAPVGQTNSIRRGAAPQREDRNYRRSMTGGSETPTILIVVALKRCLKRSPQGSLSFFKIHLSPPYNGFLVPPSRRSLE